MGARRVVQPGFLRGGAIRIPVGSRRRPRPEAVTAMLWHRELEPEDVATAHRLFDQHRPGHPNAAGRSLCASAMHLINAPAWPCPRYLWAAAVLGAESRGEIPGSNVREISA